MRCLVCEKISEGKALIVFEDQQLVAIHPNKPAAVGHIKVMPKQHYTKIEEMPEELLQKALSISNLVSSTIYDLTKAQGTNIIINETDYHASIDVIPRREGDNLNFSWKPMIVGNEEMERLFSKIKDACVAIGKEREASKDFATSSSPVAPQSLLNVPVINKPGLAKPAENKLQQHTMIAESNKDDHDNGSDDGKDDNYLHKNLTKVP